jgi:hypothetical protein
MPTHKLFNQNNTEVSVLRNPIIGSLSFNFPNQTLVTVLEENVGINCQYAYIQINETNYYVETQYVVRLQDTPQSAPYVCDVYFNNSYIEQDWTFMQNNVPYYDSKNRKYKIPFLTNYKSIVDFEQFKKDSVKSGVKLLLEYYNKDSSDSNVNKLLSYYKFAEFEDYYVRPITNTRVRSLVSIPAKYFEAQETFSNVFGIEKGKQVIYFTTRDLRKKLNYIRTIFNFYTKTLIASNIRIENFSLSSDYEKMILFYEEMINLFELNEMTLNEKEDQTIEIVLDDCLKIIAISKNINNVCSYPVVGLSVFKKSDFANNQRIINYYKNIDSIYQVDPCRISISNFINRYVLYPPQLNNAVGSVPLADASDFNQLLGFTKDLLNKVNSISLNTKETDELYKQDAEYLTYAMLELKNKYNWSNFYESKKDIFDGINFSKDLDKLNNMKKKGTKYEKYQASYIPEDTTTEAEHRKTTIKFVYNVLSFSQILCKLTPRAFQCLATLMGLIGGESFGIETNLNLVTLSNYSLEEIKTKVFPYLNKEEKKTILNELIETFCLTKNDLINVLRESKPYTDRELNNVRSYSFEQIKQLILQEIII